MKTHNICKYISPNNQYSLSTEYFIYETTQPLPGKERTLSANVMYLVAEGEAVFLCAGKHYTVKSGYVFFSFSNIPFRIYPHPGFKCFSIRFYGTRVAELFRKFNINATNFVFADHNSLIPKWKEYMAQTTEHNIDILSESLLLYTFGVLKPATLPKVSVAETMLNYLEQHFTESNLSLSALAEELGYTTKYLSTVFKRRFGIGFSHYLQTKRINYAILYFNSGATSIKNVAILSGFSDPLYFSKLFTEFVGVSPKKYIQQVAMSNEIM